MVKKEKLKVLFILLGLFSISAYITLFLHLDFILKFFPNCEVRYDHIAVVSCGNLILDLFYFVYAPKDISIFLLLAIGLLYSINSWLVFILLFLVWASAIYVLILSLNILVGEDKNHAYPALYKKLLQIGFTCLFIMITGLYALKFYIHPPQPLSRIVAINMEYDQFRISSTYLEDWSYVNSEDIMVSAERATTNRHRSKLPFMKLKIPADELPLEHHYQSDVLIDVRTNVDKDTINKRPSIMFAEKIGEKKKPVSIGAHDWFIYKDRGADFYVSKDEDGDTQAILQCTPENKCISRKYSSDSNYYEVSKSCFNELECLDCLRKCKELYTAKSDYHIVFSFHKKDLPNYFAVREDILEFLDKHKYNRETE